MGKQTTDKSGSPASSVDVLTWARHFLREYFTDPPAPFHRELFRDLAASNKRLLARVAPRGHAKSTCASFAYPLWCICHQARRNIVIITHEGSLATQFVRDIRCELECNERLLETYGDLCSARAPRARPSRAPRKKGPADPDRLSGADVRRTGGKWTQAVFSTRTGVSVQARGSGAGFRGARIGPHRPDLIICDDVEKDEQVESPEGRRKLEHWLRKVVLPALAPDGQLLVLGSIIHHDSLLANLRDRQRFPRWDYRVYRALEARPDARNPGQFRMVPLWPARWPLRRLEEERERIGTLAFEQEYMANPIDETLRVFPEQWLQRYDASDLEDRELLTVMAVDPATGRTAGDYFAVWVGSIDVRSGTIYTRELTVERIGIVKQVQRIVAAFERWRPVKIGIETTAYQVALKEILEERSRADGLLMPVVALQTIANKRARIEGASVFFENGTFRLPKQLDPEVERQFLHFPKARHDDAPDVCAMGIELARSLRVGTRVEGACTHSNPFARRGGW